MRAQPLEIDDQMRGRIVDDVRGGRRSPRPALVVEHDPPEVGIVEATVMRKAAAARPAMKEDERHAGVPPADLPMHTVTAIELKRSCGDRLARRIQQ